jgi:SAM-dependent methyltransferase
VNLLLPAADTMPELASPGSVALWLLDQVRMKAWERLLFVECGDGWVVEEAWRRMARGSAFGLSTSPHLVASAVQLRGVPGRVEFRVWGGERFPFPDQSFDRVISCVSWGWYRESAAVLHEVTRVLRVGGAAYLLDVDGSRPDSPQVPRTEGLRRLMRETGLVEVQRSCCDAVPGTPTDGSTPVLIHARWSGPAT